MSLRDKPKSMKIFLCVGTVAVGGLLLTGALLLRPALAGQPAETETVRWEELAQSAADRDPAAALRDVMANNLEKTIVKGYDGVDSASVSLEISPEDAVTAARVRVRLKPGATLGDKERLSLQKMVSGACDGLPAGQVELTVE